MASYISFLSNGLRTQVQSSYELLLFLTQNQTYIPCGAVCGRFQPSPDVKIKQKIFIHEARIKRRVLILSLPPQPVVCLILGSTTDGDGTLLSSLRSTDECRPAAVSSLSNEPLTKSNVELLLMTWLGN